jgi:hypothetical protein
MKIKKEKMQKEKEKKEEKGKNECVHRMILFLMKGPFGRTCFVFIF